MPKVVVIPGGTPVTVETAASVFGSPLRLHLLRHYASHPGPQSEACEALGVPRRTVAAGTRVLVDAGALVEEPSEDKRQRVYRVDVERVEELLSATRGFTIGSDS